MGMTGNMVYHRINTGGSAGIYGPEPRRRETKLTMRPKPVEQEGFYPEENIKLTDVNLNIIYLEFPYF